MKRIAIFASGAGTNAETIMRHFEKNPDIKCELLVCNRKNAGVFDRCRPFGVESHYFPKVEWTENGAQNVMTLLNEHKIDLIVLAGFLAIIPEEMVKDYPNRIVNIHPSLLPRHGGMGMWGHHVHQSVLDSGDKESGITIHYVSEQVDGGAIIHQAKCEVLPDDTPDTLAERVHKLEHRDFAATIERLLS